MELLVLRHGKSSWAEPALADYDRPLKKRGRRDSASMGQWIREQDLVPDMVLSSTAIRAAQTTRRALKTMKLSNKAVTWSRNFYHASAQVWLSALAMVPMDVQRVMIVGHNPGLEDLVDSICGFTVREPDGKLIPTAALVRIHLSTPWSNIGPGSGTLQEILRPRRLFEKLSG